MLGFLSRHQVASYLTFLVAGGLVSFLLGRTPALGWFEALTLPALAVLLWSTFMAVPLVGVSRADVPGRFVGRLLLLNFALVPVFVALLLAGVKLSQVQISQTLIFVAALVLLAPCTDYVVVFCGLSGGNSQRLLLATPLLLAAQLVFIPIWLYVLGALELVQIPASSLALTTALPDAVLALAALLIPLCLAWGIQRFAHQKLKQAAESTAEKFMDVAMCAVLFLTSAAHTAKVAEHLNLLLPLAGVYALFAVLAGALAWLGSRGFTRQDRIALTFSPTTRNALVMMPVVLAIAATTTDTRTAALMPLAVVTQTLVELLVMLVLTKIYTRGAK